MPEHLECEVLQKERYINPLTFTYLLSLLACLLYVVKMLPLLDRNIRCTDVKQ